VFAEGTRVADKLLIIDMPAAAAFSAPRTAGVGTAIGDGASVLSRRVHQLAAYLQPVGAAGIGPVRRPDDHP
jgi:hypothetical protein